MFKRMALWFLCVLVLAACTTGRGAPLAIEEHLLSAPPDISTEQLVYHFAQGNQDAILARTSRYKDFFGQALEYNRHTLEPFGYELREGPPGDRYFSIYRGDQQVWARVEYMGPVSLNASQTKFIGVMNMSGNTFILTRDGAERETWMQGPQRYAYVGDKMLSVEISDVAQGVSRLHVRLDDQPVYEDNFNNISTYGAYDGPWAFGQHWALVLLDAKMDAPGGPAAYQRLIQDGQDVNAAKGYEQAFEFSVLEGHPFYFYQKDGKIGISFDGQELARGYDEIPHYQCCSPALLNPGKSMNMVWFFARRGSDWYYVEAYVPVGP